MLIIGCGYVGQAALNDFRNRGRPVSALTRNPPRAADWSAAGVRGIVGDIMDPDSLSDLCLDDDGDVLFAVGYDRQSSHSIEEVYCQGLRNVLDHLHQQGAPLRRFVYLSSTGVYGDHQGDWVDEETPTAPERPGGKACVAAEKTLAAHPLTSEKHVVLRLAGIYGPGRVPRLNDIRQGKPIPAPPNTWLNLIHLDDIVQVIASAVACDAPSYRYCVSDGNPVRRHDYYRSLAELADAGPLELIEADADSPTSQRAASDKRISNRRLMDQLKVRLKFPNHRDGLAAVIAVS